MTKRLRKKKFLVFVYATTKKISFVNKAYFLRTILFKIKYKRTAETPKNINFKK
jgi:hypothetical protein